MHMPLIEARGSATVALQRERTRRREVSCHLRIAVMQRQSRPPRVPESK